jgi:haloacetate dehalogenase
MQVRHSPMGTRFRVRDVNKAFFPGFVQESVATSGAVIWTARKGSGPPLLLLHGHPQTHAAWHKIAAQLAQHFTVVLADLRGYGDSSKPDGGADHENYSPRSMALDQIEVMQHFGFATFAVAGHDRGGRVAHRMALDHPDAITHIAVIDIAPTLTMYDRTDMAFATKYVWWFFQIQPYPVPEHMIGANPEWYLRQHLEKQNKTPGAISEAAIAEYLRCYTPETIHAACEDYRAAAGIGLALDRADAERGLRVKTPLLALWGAKGVVGQTYDVLATWRERADNVQGTALDCGHLVPEEAPDATFDAFMAFFHA